MRRDPDSPNSNSNGVRPQKNGSSSRSPPSKTSQSNSTNGHTHTTNGDSSMYTNGSPATIKAAPVSFFGHDRKEVTRLLIQGLNDLGYHSSANMLTQESGYELESPSVSAFRHAVLQGEWSEADSLLFGSHLLDSSGGVSINNDDSMYHHGLLLAEGADRDELRFCLRRQKYLELLEERDLSGALMVLRQELTPLNQDVTQLHHLSRYCYSFLTALALSGISRTSTFW